jgi:uncharacterized protein with NRDE domain
MCLLVLAWRVRADTPLLLAGNRDEWYARPAAPAQFWPDAPQVLAGRDLEAGGSWLGVTRDGRFAAVTNYREARGPAPRSRGDLVRGYLMGRDPPSEYARSVQGVQDDFAGFNLLLGDRHELWWFSNRDGPPMHLPPGVYGLSNHLLDTPWPKVQTAKAALGALCAAGDASTAALLDLLEDRHTYPVDDDAVAGVDAALARAASAIFIETPHYGTRCSTVLRIGADGRVEFTERSHVPQRGEAQFDFCLDPSRSACR